MESISTLEYANFLIHTTLLKEQKKILRALYRKFNNEKQEKKVIIKGRCGGNCRSNVYLDNEKKAINDYRNYIWICVKIKNETYWITLFYNDVDTISGNMHTQFGRIQFCKVSANKKGRISPNEEVTVFDKKIKIVIPRDHYYDPQLWVDSPNYSPRKVVALFIEWIEQGKKSDNINENIDCTNCYSLKLPCCM